MCEEWKIDFGSVYEEMRTHCRFLLKKYKKSIKIINNLALDNNRTEGENIII